jgi:GNAT superfamily N-acetyltransferase
MAIRDDQFWATFLGVEPSDWGLPGVSIRAHVGLIGYRGLWCFRRREQVVVSAPEGWVPHLRARLSDGEADRLFDESYLANLLDDDFQCLIGPAFQGCLEPAAFRHVSAREVRALGREDGAAYEQLRAECGPEAVDDSGLLKSTEHVGYFHGSTLLAVAGYRPWTDVAGDPCILTHTDFHGHGYGTAVASAVVQGALNAGKLLLYQTLEANVGAVHIARKLGYEQYARHVAVRLRNEWPPLEKV